MAPPSSHPTVAVIMGSDSDLPVVSKGLDIFDELSIAYELSILSAHRTPEDAAAWARSAADRGVQVIIAAAGLAAHLPGVIAAHTTLPVIGLPIASGPLNGKDALYSIVQMPSGVPVAAVGLNNAKNAALLAAEIVANTCPELRVRLEQLRSEQASQVREKNRRIQELGWKQYLQSK